MWTVKWQVRGYLYFAWDAGNTIFSFPNTMFCGLREEICLFIRDISKRKDDDNGIFTLTVIEATWDESLCGITISLICNIDITGFESSFPNVTDHFCLGCQGPFFEWLGHDTLVYWWDGVFWCDEPIDICQKNSCRKSKTRLYSNQIRNKDDFDFLIEFFAFRIPRKPMGGSIFKCSEKNSIIDIWVY